MPQWAGSCWYYLRFIDPHNEERLVDPELEKYWLPVDLYIGGSEHAVLHLLYARFWHKVLYDAGIVSTPEPFLKLIHQGTILGELEYTVNGERVAEDLVEKQGDRFVLRDRPEVAVDARAYKMSKSRGNVVNPDEVVERFGADAFRLYEMFMGPLDQVKPWSTRSVDGTHRFLNRAWRLVVDERSDALAATLADRAPTAEELRLMHQTIAKVGEDIEALRFNTAISALMEFTNAAYKWGSLPKSLAEQFVLLLAPLAPHLAEELWQRLGHAASLAYEPWPSYEPKYLVTATVEIPVQINGKMRGRIEVPSDADEQQVIELARADETVLRYLEGKELKRAIYVRGRIVNFVVSG
jgi:leucyl-tRNA synthetase